MPKLFIHCGLPKTGTSAFQKVMRKLSSSSNYQGPLYPSDSLNPKADSHSFALRAILFGDLYGWTKYFKEMDNEDRDIVLSHEGICNRLEYRKIKTSLSDLPFIKGYDVVPVVIFRDRDKWIQSMYKQCIQNPYSAEAKQHGITCDIAEFVEYPAIQLQLNRNRLLETLEDLFEASVLTYQYEANPFREIGKLLSLPELEDHMSQTKANPSISLDCSEILKDINGFRAPSRIRENLKSIIVDIDRGLPIGRRKLVFFKSSIKLLASSYTSEKILEKVKGLNELKV